MEADGVGYGVLDQTAGRDSSRHDICALILQSKEEVTDRWDSTMVRERFEQVAQQLGDLAVLKTAVENSEVCFDWGIYRSPERKTWISPKGRTVLLGDAAHATAPFLGQGANMAMHDAYCLGQILLNPKISLSDGLQLYENNRKAYCESVVARSSRMGQVHTAVGLKASFRNTFLSTIVLPIMRKVLSTDPTKQKPWDTQNESSLVNCASGALSLIRRFGKSVGRMCS